MQVEKLPGDDAFLGNDSGIPALTLYFDGACQPKNPDGVASFGWWIEDQELKQVAQGHGVVGEGKGMTNNIAEYHALGHALRYVKDELLTTLAWDGLRLAIRGDSQLVIYQMQDEWKCNSPRLRPLKQRCMLIIADLYQVMENWIEFEWIPREENTVADVLSHKAYREYKEQTKGE